MANYFLLILKYIRKQNEKWFQRKKIGQVTGLLLQQQRPNQTLKFYLNHCIHFTAHLSHFGVC